MTDINQDYLKVEPQQANAGTTWRWTRSFTDFPANTWTLTYYFREVTGKYSFDIVATNNNNSSTNVLVRKDTARDENDRYYNDLVGDF